MVSKGNIATGDVITIGIRVQTSEANVEIDDLDNKIKNTVRNWRENRAMILHQLSDLNRGVGLLIRSIRITAEATHTTLDPMQNALLGLLSSTTSIIVSTATALSIGSMGLLAGVAITLSAFAYGMQIANTAKVIADFTDLKNITARAQAEMAKLSRQNLEAMKGFTGGGLY